MTATIAMMTKATMRRVRWWRQSARNPKPYEEEEEAFRSAQPLAPPVKNRCPSTTMKLDLAAAAEPPGACSTNATRGAASEYQVTSGLEIRLHMTLRL